jgi:tRNA dimethylallyltransferase
VETRVSAERRRHELRALPAARHGSALHFGAEVHAAEIDGMWRVGVRHEAPFGNSYNTRMATPSAPALVVLTGPTAVGKSALALSLAERFGAEIVSADSRQVYRYLDVGTAKPTQDERARVPHHLLDLVDPDQPFSVADYQAAADAALADVASRGRVALLVGGSPHYVQAVVDRLSLPRVAPRPQLRAALEELAAREGPLAVWERLRALDPVAAARADRYNVRRLIRAIEVVTATGEPFAVAGRRRESERPALHLALTAPRRELYARIDARIDAMLAAGWLQEVGGLLARGFAPSLPSLSATGYRELIQVLRGELTLPEAVTLIQHRTHAFARRQYTWLRRDPRLQWYSLSPALETQVGDRVARYLALLEGER